MRRLILLRHGKSAWDDPELPDHDRVLNGRGRRACAAIGGWLQQKGYLPDHALCSTASRTVETWGLLSRCLTNPPAARLLGELYLADADTMLEILRGSSGSVLALVGHNPGVGDLAAGLAETAPAHPDFARFPTLATLVLDFDIAGWDELAPGTGRVVDFVVPRDLTG